MAMQGSTNERNSAYAASRSRRRTAAWKFSAHSGRRLKMEQAVDTTGLTTTPRLAPGAGLGKGGACIDFVRDRATTTMMEARPGILTADTLPESVRHL
jgi:hypothetical protein